MVLVPREGLGDYRPIIRIVEGQVIAPHEEFRAHIEDALAETVARAYVVRFAATLVTGGAMSAYAEDVTLTMAVPDWPPTRIMKKFFDEQYKPKSGNTVKLDVEAVCHRGDG